MKCKYAAKLNGNIFRIEEAWGYVWGGAYHRKIFHRVRFPEGFWWEDMINPFLLGSQSQKTLLVSDLLYFKNKHNGNLSNIVEFSSDYHCLEQIYLIKALVNDYYRLGLHDDSYIFKCTVNECSTQAVNRTRRLDIDTRKQAFLALHEIISSFKHKPSGLTQKQQIFYDAIMSKDFTAWNLAAKL